MLLRGIALCTVLLLGSSLLGAAQSSNVPPPYPNQGYYGEQGYPVAQAPYWLNNPASQRGYEDGLRDGRKDFQDNHTFRASSTDKYQDAPGYEKSYGDKNSYKEMYRNGYVAGYQAGYSGGSAQAPYPVYPQAPVYRGPVYHQPGYGQPVYGQPAYANNPAYQRGFQDGLNDGQQDRGSNHNFRPMATHNYDHTPGYDSSLGDKEQYKQVYRNGYVAGYQQGFGWTGAYVQPPYTVYGGPYPVNAQPPYVNQQAYQMGYQDGITDSRDDRDGGKAFRATSNEKYEDAPGYNKSLGDKSQYKEIYRQGYMAGYQIGFNQRVR